MGSAESNNKDVLRDYDAEIVVPSHLSTPTSNIILAPSNGYYYPCIILDKTLNTNGYLVYFFHNHLQGEALSQRIIGNFEALLDCVVSFSINGKTYSGKVYDVHSNEKGEITKFFILVNENNEYIWVPFPYIFLTNNQVLNIFR